jgi:hypothetical protein
MQTDTIIEDLKEALSFIQIHLNFLESKEVSLLSTPPLVAYLKKNEDYLLLKEPEVIGNVPVDLWGLHVHEGMSTNEAEGFVLWFIASEEANSGGEGVEGDDLYVCFYEKGMEEPLITKSTVKFEGLKIIPMTADFDFLRYDYDQELLSH